MAVVLSATATSFPLLTVRLSLINGRVRAKYKRSKSLLLHTTPIVIPHMIVYNLSSHTSSLFLLLSLSAVRSGWLSSFAPCSIDMDEAVKATEERTPYGQSRRVRQ